MADWIEKFKTKADRVRRKTYTLYLAYRHPLTPWYAKVFAAVVVAYAFSPIDLIPDFIPILGYLDDLILVPLGITLALKMIPKEAIDAARQQAAQEIDDQKPKRWIVEVIIILIWIALAALMITWALKWIWDLRSG